MPLVSTMIWPSDPLVVESSAGAVDDEGDGADPEPLDDDGVDAHPARATAARAVVARVMMNLDVVFTMNLFCW